MPNIGPARPRWAPSRGPLSRGRLARLPAASSAIRPVRASPVIGVSIRDTVIATPDGTDGLFRVRFVSQDQRRFSGARARAGPLGAVSGPTRISPFAASAGFAD